MDVRQINISEAGQLLFYEPFSIDVNFKIKTLQRASEYETLLDTPVIVEKGGLHFINQDILGEKSGYEINMDFKRLVDSIIS